ncbi:hypothetical protein EVAR_74264_1 [Eumeta japonica]|uniref:Uncharacterized protein n=1 Tax=Eumeta variegata TaxID=151549 RepID=A0A4C1SCI5_EUMVA|nr:hypothetical protein EVAR_74264_1 [Eumeta japonica]
MKNSISELARARNDDWGQAIVERLEQVTDSRSRCTISQFVYEEIVSNALDRRKKRDQFVAAGNYNVKHTKWGSRLVTLKGQELAKVDWEPPTERYLYRELIIKSLYCKILLKYDMEVTQAVELFNNSIQEAAWASTLNQPGCKSYMYIYPKYIYKLIQEKRKARKNSRLQNIHEITLNLTNLHQNSRKRDQRIPV